MKTCAVESCGNDSNKRSDLSFFNIPKDPVWREDWLEVLGINRKDNINSIAVCELHFKAKDIKAGKKKDLKAFVVPVLNLGQSDPFDSDEEFIPYDTENDPEIIEMKSSNSQHTVKKDPIEVKQEPDLTPELLLSLKKKKRKKKKKCLRTVARQNKEYARRKRARESTQEKELRLKRDRETARKKRACESSQERELRNKIFRERMRIRRAKDAERYHESSQERELRLKGNRERVRQKRACESSQERELRLKKNREWARNKRAEAQRKRAQEEERERKLILNRENAKRKRAQKKINKDGRQQKKKKVAIKSTLVRQFIFFKQGTKRTYLKKQSSIEDEPQPMMAECTEYCAVESTLVGEMRLAKEGTTITIKKESSIENEPQSMIAHSPKCAEYCTVTPTLVGELRLTNEGTNITLIKKETSTQDEPQTMMAHSQ